MTFLFWTRDHLFCIALFKFFFIHEFIYELFNTYQRWYSSLTDGSWISEGHLGYVYTDKQGNWVGEDLYGKRVGAGDWVFHNILI